MPITLYFHLSVEAGAALLLVCLSWPIRPSLLTGGAAGGSSGRGDVTPLHRSKQ